jgi:hypothetical protein
LKITENNNLNRKDFFGRCFVALILLWLAAIPTHAQDTGSPNQSLQPPPTADSLAKWHEVFTYEVRYSFFELGEVKVEITSDTLADGNQRLRLQSIITSNSSVPFVGKEENHYTSVLGISGSDLRVHEFWSDNVDEENYRESEYVFDHDLQNVYANEKGESPDTLALVEPASAGHALLYFTRLTAGVDTTVIFPVYINRKKSDLTMNQTTKTEMREYDAFPGEVKTYYGKGNTDIDGPFGFSGEFESWYLADDLRVPVEARVNVWLGNVKIKLIEYAKKRRK